MNSFSKFLGILHNVLAVRFLWPEMGQGYRPTTRISSKPGPSRLPYFLPSDWSAPAGEVARAPASGAGSVVIKMIWLFLVSSAQVLARDLVCTVCVTSKLVGLFSLMMVRVPSPCELNASIVFGLKPPLSVPLPIGKVARIFPLLAFKTTQFCGLWHMTNRT